MEIFKELSKKGYKHYYEGTVEELDSMDKDNQHLHSEIIQVIMWLYEKHGIWIVVFPELFNGEIVKFYPSIFEQGVGEDIEQYYNSPTEAYEKAIKYTLNNLI